MVKDRHDLAWYEALGIKVKIKRMYESGCFSKAGDYIIMYLTDLFKDRDESDVLWVLRLALVDLITKIDRRVDAIKGNNRENGAEKKGASSRAGKNISLDSKKEKKSRRNRKYIRGKV